MPEWIWENEDGSLMFAHGEHLKGKLVYCRGHRGHRLRPAEYLCDWRMPSGKTCDRPLCVRCALQVGDDLHLCPRHYKKWLGDPERIIQVPIVKRPPSRALIQPLLDAVNAGYASRAREIAEQAGMNADASQTMEAAAEARAWFFKFTWPIRDPDGFEAATGHCSDCLSLPGKICVPVEGWITCPRCRGTGFRGPVEVPRRRQP